MVVVKRVPALSYQVTVLPSLLIWAWSLELLEMAVGAVWSGPIVPPPPASCPLDLVVAVVPGKRP